MLDSSLTRRSLCGAGLALIGTAGWSAEPTHDVTADQDFDELWRTLGERYCFLQDKSTDWNKVRALYRPLAVAAPDEAAFADVVRRVLAELYDAHTHLADPPDGAPRWPLYDVLAERAAGGELRVAAVDEGSAAADAGLAIGDLILAIDGQPADAVVRSLSPRCLRAPDPAADAYAVNVAVAGRKGRPRRLTVRTGSAAPRELLLPLKPRPQRPDVEGRRLEGGIGHIAIRSFGDTASVDAFDRALAELRDAPGLIVDVRGNGGGDTAVARPIMGRFIADRRAYAQMRRRAGAGLSQPWREYVDPRGPFTFTAPVVVLANHWSGSMAEGFPMGMRGIGRAAIVGTAMMGLGAAVYQVRLDRTGVQAQYSGEPVYDMQGRPRWLLRPDVAVADGGDILAAGIAELRRRIPA
ncbi:MAG: S41 family peptidase [Sphingomonadales bacterium]